MQRTLKEWRVHYGYSQEDLAKAINVRPSTISGWERDPEIMQIKYANRIAKQFNITLNDIIFLSDNRNLLTKREV